MPFSFNIYAFARFSLVGALFALTNAALLAFLVSYLKLNYLFASLILFFLLNYLSYLLNKTFTFKLSNKFIAKEMRRYYLVMAVSLTANLVLMYTLVDILSIHYLVASALIVVALSIFNFLGHTAFSFQHRKDRKRTYLYDVLQVSAFFPEHGGGIEVVAGQLATAWGNAGLRVAWFAGKHAADAAPSNVGAVTRFPVCYWDPLEKRIGLPLPIWRPSAALALWRTMRQSRVIQLHDFLYTPCMLAMIFARLQFKPVVLTQHIGELPIRNTLARKVVTLANKTIGSWMLSRADQIVFIAAPVQSYFSSFVHFKKTPHLIANGVDHNIFRPAPAEKHQASDAHLLFVGRFVEKKGIHLLRSSLHLPGVRWAFAGWGPLDPAQWPDLPPTVTLAGHAITEQLVSLYQQADLLVLPSIGEGFPLVVQEALACGTPVLVSKEVAEACPGRNPLCVFDVNVSEPGAEQRIQDAITSLVSSPINLRNARKAAICMAKQWSWENCAAAYSEIYKIALDPLPHKKDKMN